MEILQVKSASYMNKALFPKAESLSTVELPNQQKLVCAKPLKLKKKKKVKEKARVLESQNEEKTFLMEQREK